MMTATTITTAKPTLADLIAAHDALVTTANASGVKGQELEAMFVLDSASDFLTQAVELIAEGTPTKAGEVRDLVKWAGWKLAEFDRMAEG